MSKKSGRKLVMLCREEKKRCHPLEEILKLPLVGKEIIKITSVTALTKEYGSDRKCSKVVRINSY